MFPKQAVQTRLEELFLPNSEWKFVTVANTPLGDFHNSDPVQYKVKVVLTH